MVTISPVLQPDTKIPIYQQLYEWIRQQILNGQLKGGEKIPSLRRLAADLHVSKNTVVTAYEQLQAEGYIESVPKIGFLIAELHSLMYEPSDKPVSLPMEEDTNIYRYDLTGRGIERFIFRTEQWRKVSNEALKDELHCMAGYGDPQGEIELRREIAAYIFENRGIVCSPEQIIIGAGTQYCISFLCQMLLEDKPVVGYEHPGTDWIQAIFKRFGFSIESFPIKKDGYDIQALEKGHANIIFVTPSHQFLKGKLICAANRIGLLNWAYHTNGLIIEDDYDSEVRYLNESIPPLKSMDQNDCVIYLGSFSKIFMPSLRISFMILPQFLHQRYRERFSFYEQTASRLHQKAFALFMKEGYFESHIRRVKKYYRHKFKLIKQAIETYWQENAEIIFTKGYAILVAINAEMAEEELIAAARGAGIKIISMHEHYARHMDYQQKGRPKIYLSFKAVPMEDIDIVLKTLAEAWFSPPLP